MSKNSTDNRMEWILQLEELNEAKEDIPVYFTEYEISSEVRIPGVLTYGNGMITCALYQESDYNGLYTYLLKIKHLHKVFEYDTESYTKDGYYFKEGLIGEILAIFSSYFQVRFYLRAILVGTMTATSLRSRREINFSYIKINDDLSYLNLEMFSSAERNWADGGLTEFLDSIIYLDESLHQNLIQSLHWYSTAIKEVGVDHELFYIKTVSAIEALIETNVPGSDELSTKLYEVNKAGVFEPEEWLQIERWLENRQIRQRFIKFFDKYADSFTGKNPKEASHCYISKEDVLIYIKRIYDARSAYLHTGKPMSISMDMRGQEMKKWDLDGSLGKSSGRRKFLEKEFLPRTRWFERIANHSIKEFLSDKLSQNNSL